MKTLTIQASHDRTSKARVASTETFKPRLNVGTEGLLDIFRKKAVAKEIAEDPARISVNSKNASQMMQTVHHYLETPEAYLPSGEKVTVTTNIFGEDLRNLSVDKLLSELDKFVNNWKKDAETFLKFARKEAPFRKKITYEAEQAFLHAVRGGQTGMVGEEIMQKHVLPHLDKFFPTAGDAMASGSLPTIGCHGPLHKFVQIDAKLHKYTSIEDGSHSSHNEKIAVPVPSLSRRDLDRLFKILDKFAGKAKNGNNLDAYDNYVGEISGESEANDVFFLNKGMMLSSEEDTAEMVPVVWNSGVDSGYTVLDEYLNHVYSVIFTWCQIGLLSLRRNLSAAVENYEEVKDDQEALAAAAVKAYAEFTPATEGFVDVVKGAIASIKNAVSGDKKGTKYKLEDDQYGNLKIGKKQQGKALKALVDEALADTYQKKDWVSEHLSRVPVSTEHQEFTSLYIDGEPVAIDKVVSEFEKFYSLVQAAARKEQPFVSKRRKLFEQACKAARESDEPADAVRNIFLENKDFLKSPYIKRMPRQFTAGGIIGYKGPLVEVKGENSWVAWGDRDKLSYPAPTQTDFQKYIDALKGLLDLQDKIAADKAIEEVAHMCPHLDEVPEDVDEVDGNDFDYFISDQNMVEFGDVSYALSYQVGRAQLAIYHLLFTASSLSAANEGLMDFIKDLFDTDERSVKKILSGKKDVVAEVKQLFEKNYNNPAWIAKIPQTGFIHKAGKYDVLFYQGRPFIDGDKITAHVNEIVRYVETGCRRLSKDVELRAKLVKQLGRRGEDKQIKDAVDEIQGEVIKIAERFKSTFKPIEIIGSGVWFEPAQNGLSVSIAGVAKADKPAQSISAASVPYIRKNAVGTVTGLVEAIGKLQQMSEDYKVGFVDSMLGDGDAVFFEAFDQLEGRRKSMVTGVLFDEGTGGDYDVGSPAAVARALSEHLGKVLRAYVSWLFDRGAVAGTHEENIENFKDDMGSRYGYRPN